MVVLEEVFTEEMQELIMEQPFQEQRKQQAIHSERDEKDEIPPVPVQEAVKGMGAEAVDTTEVEFTEVQE